MLLTYIIGVVLTLFAVNLANLGRGFGAEERIWASVLWPVFVLLILLTSLDQLFSNLARRNKAP